jgi:hypothetical protein
MAANLQDDLLSPSGTRLPQTVVQKVKIFF